MARDHKYQVRSTKYRVPSTEYQVRSTKYGLWSRLRQIEVGCEFPECWIRRFAPQKSNNRFAVGTPYSVLLTPYSVLRTILVSASGFGRCRRLRLRCEGDR